MLGQVAVTGATGFIGGAICRLLRRDGWQVRALVRSPAGRKQLQSVEDECISGRLEDTDSLKALVSGATAVIHCAGTVRGANQDCFERVNVGGTDRLISVLSSLQSPPRLLALSSLAAREPQLSFYAASKRKAEEVLEQRASRLAWVALRPPAVYGPGDRELLPLFRSMAKGIAPVPGCRDARFSMIYVDDIARLVLAWLQQDTVPNGIYSVHDGFAGGYGWSDVVAAVSAICNRRVRLLPVPLALLWLPACVNRLVGQVTGHAPMLTPGKLRELRHPDWVCDNRAITPVIDWRPQVKLEEGLRKTPGWCPLLD